MLRFRVGGEASAHRARSCQGADRVLRGRNKCTRCRQVHRGLDLGDRKRSVPGPCTFSRRVRRTAPVAGGGLEWGAQIDSSCCSQYLDRENSGEAVDGPAELACTRPSHGDVIFLHGRGGNRIDTGRARESLEFGHDGSLCVLRDHQSAVDTGVVGEEGGQTVIACYVEEAVGSAFADTRRHPRSRWRGSPRRRPRGLRGSYRSIEPVRRG